MGYSWFPGQWDMTGGGRQNQLALDAIPMLVDVALPSIVL